MIKKINHLCTKELNITSRGLTELSLDLTKKMIKITTQMMSKGTQISLEEVKRDNVPFKEKLNVSKTAKRIQLMRMSMETVRMSS